MPRLLVLSLVLSLAFALQAQAAQMPISYLPPVVSVSVTAPGGGESIECGDSYTIRWGSSASISLVAISYTTDGKKFIPIEECTKNAGKYGWKVPEIDSGSVRVMVQGLAKCGGGGIASDMSDEFEIGCGPSGECVCDSCRDCSDKLEGSCEVVYLGEDISGMSEGQCVNFNADGKTFDCLGNKISGWAAGREFYYGVFTGGDNALIKNCGIEGFEVGINLHDTDGAGIVNNTLRGNYGSGAFIADSNNVRLEDNIIEDSGHGVYLAGAAGTKFEGNRICGSAEGDIFTSPWNPSAGSTRSGDTCDLIYNWNNDGDVAWCDSVCNGGASTSAGSLSGLQGALNGDYGRVALTRDIEAPGGIQLNASHVTLDCGNHKITGSGSGTGVLMANRVNVGLKNCNIEDFATGVELRGTSHSTLMDNGVAETGYGLVLRDTALPSMGNIVRYNRIASSIYAAYLDGNAYGNFIKENTLRGGRYSLYTTADCDNDIDNSNKAAPADMIAYYHDATGLNIAGGDFSEVIICNVKDSEFHSLELDDMLSGANGIIVRDSDGVRLAGPTVKTAYQGITVMNSTGISVTNAYVRDMQKDCISVSQSSGVDIESGALQACGNGVLVGFSDGVGVENMEISGMNASGITFYSSGGGEIEDNKISGAGPGGMKGIVLAESSGGNRLVDNRINGTSTGIHIDATSGGNRLEGNIVCDNGMDVYDLGGYGGSNGGDDNTCSKSPGWGDDAVAKGCTGCCSPPAGDIDEDGIDDACDCNDLLTGYGETGVDCGGRCPACVECTWCDSKVDPLRVRGSPNDGYIDVMFVPEEDFEYDMGTFRNEVVDTVRMRFLGLKNISSRPIYDGYEDMFNFYLYTGGYGKTTSNEAYYCYDPEGPEGYSCLVCSGWLPGEKEYFDFIYSCSFACAFSLGLACGCFAAEPDHFWEHASFADSVGVLTQRDVRGCSKFGPASHYTGSYCGNRGIMIIHETGHSLFSLTDEYCGDTAYHTADSAPNVWGSMGSCQSAAASEGWTDGGCAQIADGDCSKDKYKYDNNDGVEDIMDGGCGSGPDAVFKEACVRRINYVFEHWPGGGSKGIINYVDFRGGEMNQMMSRVVPNHPDLGMWVSDFTAVTQSAGGERIDEFGFSDPRKADTGDGPALSGSPFVNATLFYPIVPMHENVRWLHIFNGSSGEEMATIDMGPAIWNYCNGTGWAEEDCKAVDLDNDGIPDWQEGWGLDEAVDALSTTAPSAEAPEVETGEEDAPIVPAVPQAPAQGGAPVQPTLPPAPGGGADLGWVIAVLLVVVAALAGAFLLKRKKPGKEEKTNGKKQKKPGKCPKCGAKGEPGNAFCPECGAKL